MLIGKDVYAGMSFKEFFSGPVGKFWIAMLVIMLIVLIPVLPEMLSIWHEALCSLFGIDPNA